MPMQKFGFRIKTRAGMVVENLIIQGADLADAERKLRQMYHHCSVLEARTVDETTSRDVADVESAISLIVGQDKRT